MADGSHVGFIQKPVTFELFEITMLVFQLFGLNTKGQNYYITQIQQCEKILFKKKILPTYPIFLKPVTGKK